MQYSIINDSHCAVYYIPITYFITVSWYLFKKIFDLFNFRERGREGERVGEKQM